MDNQWGFQWRCAVDGSSILWFYYPGSYATVEFDQPGTSIAFMLQSDANDGLVNFYVDNTEVLHHFDMQTLPGTTVGGRVGTLVVQASRTVNIVSR